MWFKTTKKRVSELEEEVQKIRRDMRELEMEWSDAYEKLQRMAGRIAKRSKYIEQKEEAESPLSVAPGAGSPENGSARGHMLTPRQMEVQQSVLRRRMGISGR